MTHPTEFALRLVKQGFLQAHRLQAIGFLTITLFFILYTAVPAATRAYLSLRLRPRHKSPPFPLPYDDAAVPASSWSWDCDPSF